LFQIFNFHNYSFSFGKLSKIKAWQKLNHLKEVMFDNNKVNI
jgi:hypothetical protein